MNPRTRNFKAEDLLKIQEFLTRVKFDVGIHILEIYLQNSKAVWTIAENESNEIVAFDSYHELEFPSPLERFYFGYELYIREDYQGYGLSQRFLSVTSTAPASGNVTAMSLERLVKSTKFDMKLLTYEGYLNLDGIFELDEANTTRISLYNMEKDNDLLSYDRQIYDSDRSKFTREWCSISSPNEHYSRTLIARNRVDRDEINGYGTIRRFSNFFAIMPLYANDENVAKLLLNEIVRLFLKENKNEYIPVRVINFNANCRVMMQFVHQMKFKFYETLMRHYWKGSAPVKKYIRFENAYAIHEYWPV